MSIISVSRLAPRNATWLWRDRFPLGKIVLLDGDPGLGKSFITLDLCARISTGRPFPDGSPGGEPGNCMVLNGDDAADEAIHDRLQTLGADLDRVFVPNLESDLRMLHLPADWPKLDQAISGAKIRFLVIDPIMAFLSSRVVTASDQSVREALFPLVLLAEKHGCVILLVRHLNKSGGSRSLYRGGGSIAFQGLCRAAWLAARDPLDTGSCVFANVKNNYAQLQPSLAYVVARTDPAHPTLSWIGAHALPADELLARSGWLLRPVHRARDFLRTFLENGPRTVGDIWQGARKEGFSKRTLSRARNLLQIRTHWTRANGQCVTHWRLPHHNPPSTAPPSLEPWLAPLRERFPRSTPLDDL